MCQKFQWRRWEIYAFKSFWVLVALVAGCQLGNIAISWFWRLLLMALSVLMLLGLAIHEFGRATKSSEERSRLEQ
jgi:hypothetical protein